MAYPNRNANGRMVCDVCGKEVDHLWTSLDRKRCQCTECQSIEKGAPVGTVGQVLRALDRARGIRRKG